MSQAQRIVEMLEPGPKTTGDFLAAHIGRFGARILELRRAGYDIRCEPIEGQASHRYWLAARPDPATHEAPPPAPEPALPPNPLAELCMCGHSRGAHRHGKDGTDGRCYGFGGCCVCQVYSPASAS